MTQPDRQRRPTPTSRRGHAPTRPAGTRRLFSGLPTVGPPPVTTAPGPSERPTSPVPAGGLTVTAVVAPGAVVGLDDSSLVHTLLDELVDARPSLVGTASLAAVLSLSATPPARGGELTVRLFGGELLASAGVFTGPSSLRALTTTRCDVALVGGRLVGHEVWVPADAATGRRGLLLAAQRSYLVVTTADDHDLPIEQHGWVRLAGLADFDGVIVTSAPPERPHRSAAA